MALIRGLSCRRLWASSRSLAEATSSSKEGAAPPGEDGLGGCGDRLTGCGDPQTTEGADRGKCAAQPVDLRDAAQLLSPLPSRSILAIRQF